jgi:methionyl-tRNA formyltransferase
MERRLRIVLLATAQFAVPTLEALAQDGDDIAAVITRPDRPAGRGRKLRPPPVKDAAQRLGLPVFQPERVSKPEGVELLRNLAPDLLLVAAFGEILSEDVLAIASLGATNLHASLLPRYRGAAPIQRAILAGERETGVTVQWMAREMDAGDILLRRSLTIGEYEDFGSLHDRLAAVGADAVLDALDLIRQGEAPREPQDHSAATYAPSVKPDELIIDWREPAAQIARRVRAFSPLPGARTTRGSELLKILAAREAPHDPDEGVPAPPAETSAEPGRVAAVTSEGFCVHAVEGRLLVLRVQPAGGKPMPAAAYAKGHRLARGEVLGAAS